MTFKKKQIDCLTWCGQQIPITAFMNANDRAISLPSVERCDMPAELLADLDAWIAADQERAQAYLLPRIFYNPECVRLFIDQA